MLTINEALETLKTYNINSQKYEPTIYQKENQIGICLDIKDSLFGYLTRAFTFKTKEELDNFLKGFFWYKNNHNQYSIKLTLDSYNTPYPQIIYKYQNETITINEMLNINEFLENEKKDDFEKQEKTIYLNNIARLTNYLIDLKKQKEVIKQEKNKLKTEENNLKYELLTELTTYYGRERNLPKKEITLDSISIVDPNLLLENEKNIKDKSINEVKGYLISLINIIKNEEIDEKNFVNIYSNNVYEYNIEILKKQIEFVKSKIKAEQNFNLKGSKIHNIDEELKSFLKVNIAPVKIEIFLADNKNRIEEKYQNITDIKEAANIITGKTISFNNNLEKEEKKDLNLNYYIREKFNELPKKDKNNLILYHSIYKPICNFIIDNNYPNIDIIKSNFDFEHYYEELETIIMNENNNHYLIQYFKEIDFKNINTYINSIINICKNIENTFFNLPSSIKLFTNEQNSKWKQLTKYPNKNTKYLVEAHNIAYLPEKLEIDWNTNEISLINEESYYIKENIIKEEETVTLTKYTKKNIEKNDIIITTDLILEDEININKSHLEGA